MIREEKVMLDSDLAELYGVETRVLNQQVKRNLDRFPLDFMFQLEEDEWSNLKSQNVTSSWGGRRTLPYVFTEHGVLMLSSVLNSPKAISVNIRLMRIFTKMREMLLSHKDLFIQMEKIRHRVRKQDERLDVMYKYLKSYIENQETLRNKLGFKLPDQEDDE